MIGLGELRENRCSLHADAVQEWHMRVPAQSLDKPLCFDLYYSAWLMTNESRIKPSGLPACASYAFLKTSCILENLRVQ
jgi:hypothetical protein